MRRKITVVGAGEVGVTTAQRLAERGDRDVVVVDLEERADPDRLHLADAAAVVGSAATVTLTGGFDEAAGSQIVVLSEGDEDTVRAAARQVARRCPDAVVVVATEPVEALCHVVLETTLFPRARVLGTGRVVASARLCSLLARELGVALADVSALVLGSRDHMVPVLSCASVSGLRVAENVGAERLAEIAAAAVAGTPRGESYAHAAAVAEIVDAMLADAGRVLAVAALCRGEFDLDAVFVAVPATLEARGVREILPLVLSDEERAGLNEAAAGINPPKSS
jgi:malate dehydrogenase